MNIRTLYFTILSIVVCLSCQEEPTPIVGTEISLPEGFEATLLYSPSDHDQGSWVSLVNDPQGRLIASDQYGSLYRVTLPEKGDEVEVETIPIKLGSAQGMLWAFDALYVSVNAREDSVTKGSGLYKVTDSDGDDELDQVEKLFSMEGNGEHGPHGLILGPNGKDMYLIAGNHTDVPESFSSLLSTWEEDRLFEPILDPGGHANDRMAPGGWIAKSSDQGQTWQVVANGFRNAYDIAFDPQGELFTFDSDMEWDLGTPWYRPIRVCHVIPGAEFGWRTGSGKWAAYYPDNLPGVINIGQGSPTGIAFGTGAKFPSEYQESLYILDWSFGTMYQIQMTSQGASYLGSKQEFLSGTPLPLTDMVIGHDGNMYFTTGGRRVASQLYRVRYVGDQPTDKVASSKSKNENLDIRRAIEMGTVKVEDLWSYLSHEDRFVRYAARVALENTDVKEWVTQLTHATDPSALIQASLIISRRGYSELRPQIIKGLSSIDVASLAIDQQLNLVRAYALLFIRTGPAKRNETINLPDYPSGNPALDRELCELLVYLGKGDIIEVTLDLMEEAERSIEADLTPVEILERSEQYGPTIAAMHQNRPTEQGLAFALALSNMEKGWTPELRNRYFTWFYRAFQKSGGVSYKGFVERIRQRALSQVPDREKEQLAELSGESLLQAPSFDPNIPQPEGPARTWLMSDANRLVYNQLHDRDFTKGKQHFQALTCSSCHAMRGEGGNVGPDLTQAGTRFSSRDMLYAMIFPSNDITDQYGATLYTLKDGSTIIGRTLRTSDETVYVATNPYNLAQETEIPVSEVASSEPSPVSLMPAGLINRLNEEELLDLMAYLTSGGDPNHEVYGKTEAGP
jgi:putative heme-binding domain-containing protein